MGGWPGALRARVSASAGASAGASASHSHHGHGQPRAPGSCSLLAARARVFVCGGREKASAKAGRLGSWSERRSCGAVFVILVPTRSWLSVRFLCPRVVSRQQPSPQRERWHAVAGAMVPLHIQPHYQQPPAALTAAPRPAQCNAEKKSLLQEESGHDTEIVRIAVRSRALPPPHPAPIARAAPSTQHPSCRCRWVGPRRPRSTLSRRRRRSQEEPHPLRDRRGVSSSPSCAPARAWP